VPNVLRARSDNKLGIARTDDVEMRLDVLVFGGGAAGLWCLDRFRRAGYHAILLESTALGSGQTIQAQGIIHGGGKYALRGVRDFAAVRATERLPAGEWPEALRGSALAVYSLAEPVVSTGSLLENLAAHHRGSIFLYDAAALRFLAEGVLAGGILLQPRATVLAAGVGNEALLSKAGMQTDLMQRRPLGMVLLRGSFPPLFGHCVVGGKTGLTITSPVAGLWQVGGEIAERLAHEETPAAARKIALAEIRRWLPGLDLTRSEIAIYRAVRAEGRTEALRRPSGVHASRVAPGLVVAWPTKLSMAPVLADEVFELVNPDLKGPGGYAEVPPWPVPGVARYPWEEVEWFPAH
jgi:hypothetical protein